MPYGFNPFGATFFPMVPHVTQQAHQLVKKTAAPSPAVVGDSQDDDCDSVLEEAREAATKATNALPAKGWLNTSINKSRKAFEQTKNEQREAATAAKKAETDAAKAAKAATAAIAKGCNTKTHERQQT